MVIDKKEETLLRMSPDRPTKFLYFEYLTGCGTLRNTYSVQIQIPSLATLLLGPGISPISQLPVNVAFPETF
jgi:hypothetical protein